MGTDSVAVILAIRLEIIPRRRNGLDPFSAHILEPAMPNHTFSPFSAAHIQSRNGILAPIARRRQTESLWYNPPFEAAFKADLKME